MKIVARVPIEYLMEQMGMPTDTTIDWIKIDLTRDIVEFVLDAPSIKLSIDPSKGWEGLPDRESP